MKKLFIALLGVFLFISCSSDDKNVLSDSEQIKKENYIKENFPKVLNLEKSELDSFKDNMIFDKDGVLTSWQGELLEKAYQDEDEYTKIYFNLYKKLGLNPSKIVIVDGNNNERVLRLVKNNTRGFGEEMIDKDRDPYVREIWNAYNSTPTTCTPQSGRLCSVLVK